MFSARSIWRLIQKIRSATRESISERESGSDPIFGVAEIGSDPIFQSTTQVSFVPPP